ncbi:uncharacterized protein LOC105694519 [Orussus abietinus]|uniref:uncharacterized protein LOC105694519 n=1 Tax=Orussus abietinus TaxID=222816 RepID=UPI000626141B|nr:uncharacterized protein LOC105694519 [Orussus abietinus]
MSWLCSTFFRQNCILFDWQLKTGFNRVNPWVLWGQKTTTTTLFDYFLIMSLDEFQSSESGIAPLLENGVEFTLEDVYESLKDIKKERLQELETLVDANLNNEAAIISPKDIEKIKKKQVRLFQCLSERLEKECPKDYPILKTSDLYVETIKELEKEVQDMQGYLEKMQNELKESKDDIVYLEKKKQGLENMRKAYQGESQKAVSKTYMDELALVNRLFKSVKTDLHLVVDTLFPNNEDFKDLLGALTTAYTNGGDDIYIDLIPETLLCATFLIEGDIAVYHPNDTNKIKLAQLL